MSESRGWLVSVHSKPVSGNRPASRLYAARIADPEAAILAVRRYAHISDERLQIIVETTVSQLRAIKVPDGKVRRVRSISRHLER
jgi:rhodanese-related sulfurtransferase